MNIHILKQDDDQIREVERLTATWERRLRVDFLERINEIKEALPLDTIIILLEQGRIERVLELVDQEMSSFWSTSIFAGIYLAAGQSTAQRITGELRGDIQTTLIGFDTQQETSAPSQRRPSIGDTASISVGFNTGNARTVQFNNINGARFVREITEEQRATIRNIISSGLSAGRGVRQVAVDIRNSIGLTTRQLMAVENFSRLLEGNNADALQRILRDRRFDSTIRNAIREDISLTSNQINRMVQRYRERYLIYRSEVIARTETLTALNAARFESYQQAVDQGSFPSSRIERTWRTNLDGRERTSHRLTNNQKVRGLNSFFTVGSGAQLQFPGDARAPASEIVQCRCITEYNILPRGA